MEAGGCSSAIPRLKREECKRTKHDSNFSDWKILIGPSDWEDYSRGKEGSARYRIHNLPDKLSPGVYELGIAVSRIGLRLKVYKLDPDRIVVVYLGKADNVRARLQQYGRTGAHLSNNCLTSDPDDSNPACTDKGKGFFEEIFSQGYPIIYRWAPMQNKEDAKKTESQLLSVFDYAWNTSNNGTRRPNDILKKIKVASGHTAFSSMAKLLQPFNQKRVGIRIKSSSMPFPDGKLQEIDGGSYNFLSRVFKFGRSNPRLVQDVPGVMSMTTRICGVVSGDGSVCRRAPAERRMRCVEHEGMRINGSTSKRTMKSENNLDIEFNVPCHQKSEGYGEEHVPIVIQDNTTGFCGVVSDDGSVCTRPPTERRMRDGMRINESTSKRTMKSENNLDIELNMPGHQKSEGCGEEHVPVVIQDNTTGFCGVVSDDGSVCTRPPTERRMRCVEHDGMRINESTSKRTMISENSLDIELNVPCHLKSEGYGEENVSQDLKDLSHIAVENPLDGRITNICGIILNDGTPCRMPPVKDRKRCHEHKGKRINHFNKAHCDIGVENPLDGRITNICGIVLNDGTPCMRPPVKGRKRCHEHKGKRINHFNKAYCDLGGQNTR